MVFIVLPATIPDIVAVYDVYFAAFEGEPVAEILFPWDVNNEDFRKGHTAHTLDYWHHDDLQYTFKCVDMDTGEIVGMALWDVHWKHRSQEKRKKPAVDWLKDQQKERAEQLILPLWERKEQVLGGQPHVYCHFIAVHPQSQRRGVGALLTQWGVEVGNRLGVPVYLEATDASVKLYKNLGFQKLSPGVILEAGVIGEQAVEAPVMVKMPVSAAGLAFEDWIQSDYPDLKSESS